MSLPEIWAPTAPGPSETRRPPAGELTSFVEGTPYFSARLELGAAPLESLTVPKPTGAVTLHLVDRDSLIMTDPARGELRYRRAP